MRPRRPRWRCLLCPAKGSADTFEKAQDDGQQHYITTHMAQKTSKERND